MKKILNILLMLVVSSLNLVEAEERQTYTEFVYNYSGIIVLTNNSEIEYDKNVKYVCNTSLLGYDTCANSTKKLASKACEKKGEELAQAKNKKITYIRCIVS